MSVLKKTLITAMSFELGGYMGYQNSYLDESFLFHQKFFWVQVWFGTPPSILGGDFQNALLLVKPTPFDQKLKSRN